MLGEWTIPGAQVGEDAHLAGLALRDCPRPGNERAAGLPRSAADAVRC